jgi:uncharacterized membrane protein
VIIMELVVLVLGLAIFLGVHSLKFLAPQKRELWLERYGEKGFKARYSLASLVGLIVIVVGYGQARLDPVLVWIPPHGAKHLALLLVWLSFVFVLSAYFYGNEVKNKLHHPMLVGVKTWAIAHLLANGLLHQMVFFGSLLAWAVVAFIFARKRDRLAAKALEEAGLPPQAPAPSSKAATGLAFSVATILFLCFAAWGHAWLIGVNPLRGV